uniref:SCP domain-containing protein n=1 Tax=Caenorhabditis japonica TaxID=281687 RepID=A0A8R1HYJ5_CAEJA
MQLCLFAFLVIYSAAFSVEYQQKIVDAHNELRSAVAIGNYVAKDDEVVPPAANMLKMIWNDSLANEAQKFAEECPEKHGEHPGTGENLFKAWDSELIEDVEQYSFQAVKMWESEFAENGFFSNIYTKETKKKGIGHATQMLWATAGQVGCGAKNCGVDEKLEGMNKVVMVCRYIERGNVKGNEIYKTGETCSDCPIGTNCEESSGLCIENGE